MAMYDTITGCRSCGSPGLLTVLALGEVPLANALLAKEQLGRPEPRVPLTLAFCEACSLVQILETVDPEVLFAEYVYRSSFSETMLAHARASALSLIGRLGLGRSSFVVEVASNDGYLLKNFVEAGIPVLGIEPARNIAQIAIEAGVPTRCDFFGQSLGAELARTGPRADLMLANNVLAHVADTNGIAAGFASLLAPHGTAVIEFPYLGDLVRNTEFDTIYHEHLCYFSLHAVSALFARHGLAVVDVERLPIHGGSLRIYLQHETAGTAVSDEVHTLLAEEHAQGMLRRAYYLDFAERVAALGEALTAELRRRKAAGQRLAAYGASAKGSTLLHAFRIDGALLDFIADRSDLKQGRFAPGNHLPILAPEALLERRPDAVLLLTWNFADEILRQQRAYLEAGGTFIVPVPRVRTVGIEDLR